MIKGWDAASPGVVCPLCDERYSSPYELRMRRLGEDLEFCDGEVG